MKKKIYLLITIVLSLFLVGCIGDVNDVKEKETLKIDYNDKTHEVDLNYDTKNPVVEMEFKDYGKVYIELYKDTAPNTVNNFIYLTHKGFYDNNTSHRLIEGFVLQGGDPTGTGTGGPGYSIKGEFTANNFKNDLLHTEKVVSMARSNSFDSAGSQFFIMLGTAAHLDNQYASFGMVIDGWDVIEKIVEENRNNVSDDNGTLKDNLTITSAKIDLNGYKPESVEIIKE